jgi:enoyl-CoA hydratase/carnithine racemase
MIAEARDDGLLVLTLTRPDKANAQTKDMLTDLAEKVEAGSSDGSIRAIVLTGAGRVFSAGADLDAARSGLAVDPIWERVSGALAECPVLTIAALNGSAVGGALGMVLACDLRVAVPTATIFYPVMKLGFLPQPSDPRRLASLVGPARAKLILMGGAKIGAVEALAIGLVDRIADDAMELSRGIAAASLGAARSHVSAMKAMV